MMHAINTKILSLIVALVFCCQVDAQQSYSCGELVKPESIGLDSKQLSRIDEAAQNWVDQGKIAGCSAMVLRNGQLGYFKAWGSRDLEAKLPIERDTIFRIYSMTKPVTSIAALQLIEQEKLGLDDPVAKYLPEFAKLTVFDGGHQYTEDGKVIFDEVPAQRDVTIRDLMTHTSGLSYGFFGDTSVDKEYRRMGVLITDGDLEQMVQKLGKIPLLYQPGSRFHYSASTDVLGRVIEVVSGKTLAEYFEENIFAPLGIVDSSFMVSPKKQDRFAQMYVPDETAIKLAPMWESFRFKNQANRFFSGGSGLCATIDDYGRIAQMIANRGELDGVKILRPETTDLAFTNQLENLQTSSGRFNFGLGLQIKDRGKNGKDYSWGGAAGTRFWSNPDKKLAILFMVQIKPDTGGFGETIRDIVYDAIVD